MDFIMLPDHDQLPIHCPFCGKKVIDLDADQPFGPCEHVLSAFHAEGVEYEAERSPRADAGDDEEGESALEQWEKTELPGAVGFQLGQRIETRHYIVFAP